MDANDISKEVFAMKGLVLESNRTIIALRFADLIQRTVAGLYGNESDEAKHWNTTGRYQFLGECGVENTLGMIDPNITVPGNELSQILDTWMRCSKYRDSPEGDWKEIPPDAQNILVTFINQLREFAQNNLTPTDS